MAVAQAEDAEVRPDCQWPLAEGFGIYPELQWPLTEDSWGSSFRIRPERHNGPSQGILEIVQSRNGAKVR